MLGSFSPASLSKFQELVGLESNQDFSEGVFDFKICERPNGSRYGTSGKCRQGAEVSAKDIEREEKKLADLKTKLASAEEKEHAASSRASGAGLGRKGQLITAGMKSANAAAAKAITAARVLREAVNEQTLKLNEMKGVAPEKAKTAPRSSVDERRGRIGKLIDSINNRAQQVSSNKGKDSPEFKRFVQKYGPVLQSLMDERQKTFGKTEPPA